MMTFTDVDAARIVDEATDRILELEAALREIIDFPPGGYAAAGAMQAIARNALDKTSSDHDPVTATATGAM